MNASTHAAHIKQTLTIQLDTLPTEIQDLIFDYVVIASSTAELKRLRQSNSYFRDRADIHLFRTLHISASNLSLARVKAISEDERLSAHVRELVYHRGTWSGHKLVHYRRGSAGPRDYGDFEEYMMRGEPGFRPSQSHMMRVSACFVAFSEEVRAESDFNREMSWQSEMRSYCARFRGLEALRTVSDAADLQSEYLKRRCGLLQQSWTPNYFAPYEIFAPCGNGFRPRALWMDSVNGEDFAAIVMNIRGGEAVVRERFEKLQELRISFSETVATLGVEGTYDVFVASCRNLRALSLDFTSFYSPKILKDPESLPQRLIGLVLKSRFERLAKLELVYPQMREVDFISFLKEHVSSLKDVTVDRWPMPVTEEGRPTGSVIRALWAIGQIDFKSLASFVVEGECSSSKTGDGWIITRKNEGVSSIAARIRRYFNHQEPYNKIFPISIDTKKMLEAKTEQELQAIDEMPHALGCCDDTFSWSGSSTSSEHLSNRRGALHHIEPWE